MMGRTLGKKAILAGAIAQWLPDADVLASLWLEPAPNLLAHRGITHSLFFVILVSILSGLIVLFNRKTSGPNAARWWLFLLVQTGSHVFLDLFNNYGVGLWEPFHHDRFSFNALYVADPFFTIGPLTGFLVLLFSKKITGRAAWWKAALILPLLYLSLSLVNKWKVNQDLKQAIPAQNVAGQSFISTPSPFNNLLWYFIVKTDSGFYTGYRSVFDNSKRLYMVYTPRYEHLLENAVDEKEVELLKRFSQGYFTAEYWGDTLVMNDLRFGKIIGWQKPGENFVFHYFLAPDGASNKLVVQRGRLAKWNHETLPALARKILVR
jgi:inner membrane protein